METKRKERYEAPLVEVFLIAQESMLCASPTETTGSPDFEGMNSEKSW